MKIQKMINDAFSEFLSLMSARSVMSGGLKAGGKWAISLPASDRIKFWGVARGNCWLVMEGEGEAVRVEEGDVFLLCVPRSHVLASDLETEPVDLAQVLEGRTGVIAHHGQGDEFFMIGGKVELDVESAQLLLDALPPLIHIRGSSSHAPRLHWLLNQLVQEREEDLPGASVATAQLAHLMFIQILRAWLATAEPLTAGWLHAVSDKRLAPALRLMHGEPGRAWQLDTLAKAAAMSRATFAAYFKTVAGIAPMAYLTQWRMRLAVRALRQDQTPVGVLAQSLGYASESAFSHAFKRVTGHSPKRFRGSVITPQTPVQSALS
ncbi:MAG: AraC family transcriptional regulator [Pseudomonas sp.]